MKVGDLVQNRYRRQYRRRIGLITKVFLTKSGNEEYRVEWLNAGGRSRYVRGLLELVSEER